MLSYEKGGGLEEGGLNIGGGREAGGFIFEVGFRCFFEGLPGRVLSGSQVVPGVLSEALGERSGSIWGAFP